MLLRQIFDDKLAQYAYLIGCQATGEAVVIDPERDVDRYIEAAEREGLRITAVAETHIHADFLSGARELAERLDVELYLSAEGRPDWQVEWACGPRLAGGEYRATFLRHGDRFRVGNVELRALHTPGHTPEHLSYVVIDHGGGASGPIGIATGDFVFVGDLGRPDLFEQAPASRACKRSPRAPCTARFRSSRGWTTTSRFGPDTARGPCAARRSVPFPSARSDTRSDTTRRSTWRSWARRRSCTRL